jgi:ABC-2 type transport system permease protein
MSMPIVVHSLALTKRSVRGRLRQPAVLAPSFIFPLFFAALGSASFNKLAEDPYFRDNIASSFLNYAIAGAILQGVLFASTSAAGDLATDIEQGFFERLLASPITRTSIVLGRLAGSMVVGVVQVTVFLTIFGIAGARVHSGPIGILGLVVGSALLGLAMSALMAGLAIKSGSPEVVQGAFPLVFVLLFLSSAFFPRHYMSGWYGTVADWNPMSHIVEGMQSFVNHDLEPSQFVRAWLIPLGIAVVSIAFALRSLSKRLAAS